MNEEQQKKLIEHINNTPRLLGALYDMNLLPEQHTDKESNAYWFMLGIAFRDKYDITEK